MPGIDWWYEQNTIFYVKRNSAANAWFVKRFANPSDTMFDVVQKLLNRFRQSAGEPRRKALETPPYGDENWRGGGDAKTKSGP